MVEDLPDAGLREVPMLASQDLFLLQKDQASVSLRDTVKSFPHQEHKTMCI
jgi:hypothetical protein